MKITKRQLRRIIKEASSFHAEERGMAAAYREGLAAGKAGEAYPPPGHGDPEYMRGYEKGLDDRQLMLRSDLDQSGSRTDPTRDRMREAEGSTKKYDDDSALKGAQSKLPDGLQKGIIDKAVDDRDDQEEEEREEKNEGTTLDNMPDAWRQILGKCLGE